MISLPILSKYITHLFHSYYELLVSSAWFSYYGSTRLLYHEQITMFVVEEHVNAYHNIILFANFSLCT